MPHLVKEDDLTQFLTNLGLDAEHLAPLDHEDLLGLHLAVCDHEALHHHTPQTAATYGQNGYATGIKTLAARGGNSTDEGFATLSVRLAEHTIGRLIAQLGDLETDPDTPPLMKSVLASLFAAGVLLNLTNRDLAPADCRTTVRTVQARMSDARQGLEDVKKNLKAKEIRI